MGESHIMKIRPMTEKDILELKAFTDMAIGENYYSTSELAEIYNKSIYQGHQCSLVLEAEDGKIHGVRISYPPGHWEKGKGKGLSTEKWGIPLSQVAYFQSLFIHPQLTGKGWGKKMSLAAIHILRNINAKAIVTHSWKESPQGSSGKYLRSLGFELVATHPLYWKEVDYVCTRCGKPCLCTAEEMILYLK